MDLFNVYPVFDIEPVKAEGAWLWDKAGTKYLDLYGGHAVISIGHTHPHFVSRIEEQLKKLAFYSNSVQNGLQKELAAKLGELSGYEDHSLFLCNSGAEAIENALKLASFHTGRKKVLAITRAFHGRTAGAVAITHNPKIQAPVNDVSHVSFIDMNDEAALEEHLKTGEYCAFIIESIQGVGGIHLASESFLQSARKLCSQHGSMFIADEIQAGFGRSGKFFSHQHAGIEADLITMAKGMGNGFPVGGVLISPVFESWFGMLGTTFGGNHLACAATLAVLEVLEKDELVHNAAKLGKKWMKELAEIPGIVEVRGKGLMIGLELASPAKPIRKQLLFEHKIFTGSSSEPNVLRLLPPLGIGEAETSSFTQAMNQIMVHPIA
ncbi:MAG: aminotransferase class III-fold pyridoxal phosphate-dependent enzyme [Bacteroidota bacterium]